MKKKGGVNDDGKVYLTNWRSSKAKQVLKKLIENGDVTTEDTPEAVYQLHDEFKLYKFENFKTNLKNLIAAVDKEKGASVRDEAAFQNDLALCGRTTHTRDGIPVWAGSTASRLLREDIGNGIHRDCTPTELWRSRVEYQRFPLNKFRDRIYTTERKFLERGYWLNRISKKKKQKEEIDEMVRSLNFKNQQLSEEI